MKIRQGFVSNSSSSSFIIGLDDKPKSVKEVQDIFFGNSLSSRLYDVDEPIPNEVLADKIFNDINKAKEVSEDEIIEELCSGFIGYKWEPGGQQYYEEATKRSRLILGEFREKFPGEEIFKNKEWQVKYQKACDKESAEFKRREVKLKCKFWRAVKSKFKGKKIYIVEYGDHDIIGSFLEHGGVFDIIPSVRVSHH